MNLTDFRSFRKIISVLLYIISLPECSKSAFDGKEGSRNKFKNFN